MSINIDNLFEGLGDTKKKPVNPLKPAGIFGKPIQERNPDSLDLFPREITNNKIQERAPDFNPSSQFTDRDAIKDNLIKGEKKSPKNIFNLANKNQMPVEYVNANYDRLKRQDINNILDSDNSPLTRAYFRRNPEKIDYYTPKAIEELNGWEKMWRVASYKKTLGKNIVGLSDLGVKAALGKANKMDWLKIKDIQSRNSLLNQSIEKAELGFIQSLIPAASGQIDNMIEMLKGSFGGKWAGTAAGAVLGLPFGLSGAVTGARIGGSVGSVGGTFYQSGELHFGLNYIDFRSLKDNTGRQISHKEALGASVLVASSSAGLDVFSFRQLLKIAPSMNKIGNKKVKEALVNNPTFRKALVGKLPQLLKAIAWEGATEKGQTTIEQIGKDYFKKEVFTPDGSIDWTKAKEKLYNFDEAVEAMKATFVFGSATTLPSAGVETIRDKKQFNIDKMDRIDKVKQEKAIREGAELTSKMEESYENADNIKKQGEKAQDFFKKFPEDAKNILAENADKNKFLYILPNDFKTISSELKKSSTELASDVFQKEESLASYSFSMQHGIMIKIPEKDYFVNILPTAMNNVFARYIKHDVDIPNEYESDSVSALIERTSNLNQQLIDEIKNKEKEIKTEQKEPEKDVDTKYETKKELTPKELKKVRISELNTALKDIDSHIFEMTNQLSAVTKNKGAKADIDTIETKIKELELKRVEKDKEIEQLTGKPQTKIMRALRKAGLKPDKSRDFSKMMEKTMREIESPVELEIVAKKLRGADFIDFVHIMAPYFKKNNNVKKSPEEMVKSFEDYIMNGKASEETEVFISKFRSWLVYAYNKLSTEYHLSFTNDIARVMDSLIVAEDRLSKELPTDNNVQFLGELAVLGIKDKKLEAVTSALSQSYTLAIHKEVMGELLIQKARQAKGYRSKLSKELKEITKLDLEENSQRYEILKQLKGAKKIDVDKLSNMLSDDLLRVPEIQIKLKAITKKNGLDPLRAFLDIGISDLEYFITWIMENPITETEIEYYRSREAQISLEKKEPNLIDKGKIQADMLSKITKIQDKVGRQVIDILFNEKLPQFKSIMGVIADFKMKTESHVKDWAKKVVGTYTIQGLNPKMFKNSAQASGNLSVKEFLKGSPKFIFHKINHLATNQLYEQSTKFNSDIKNKLEKGGLVSNLLKKISEEKFGKYAVREGALIHQLLFRFGFTTMKPRMNVNFKQWYDEAVDTGYPISFPSAIVNSNHSINYNYLKVSSFNELMEILQTLNHISKIKDKFFSHKSNVEYEGRTKSLSESILKYDIRKKGKGKKKDEIEIDHATGEPVKSWVENQLARIGFRGFKASQRRMQHFLKVLDGNKENGLAYNSFFQPFFNGEQESIRLREKLDKFMNKGFKPKQKNENFLTSLSKTLIKRKVKWKIDNTTIVSDMRFVYFLAINWTVKENKDRLLNNLPMQLNPLEDGSPQLPRNMTEKEIVSILKDNMTKEDVNNVNKVSNSFNLFWDSSVKLSQETTGKTPVRVESTPFEFTTKNGDKVTLHSQYFPIRYQFSKILMDKEIDNINHWVKSNVNPITKEGSLIERMDEVPDDDKVLRTDVMNILSEGYNNIIHYLSMTKAVIDSNRTLKNKSVKSSIVNRFDIETYNAFEDYIKDISVQHKRTMYSNMEKFMAGLRRKATTYYMGFRATVILTQVLGYSVSIQDLGRKYALEGFLKASNRKEWEKVFRLSKWMRARKKGRSLERDLINISKFGKQKSINDLVFAPIVFMDLVVSTATWLGAYEKALDGATEGFEAGKVKTLDAVKYADAVVARTQGSGTKIHLSGIQRSDKELNKLVTMFFTYFNVLYNQAFVMAPYEVNKNKQEKGLTSAAWYAASSAMLLMFLPAIGEIFIRGHLPDTNDDDELRDFFLKTMVYYPAGTIPIIRSLISPYEFQLTPAEGLFDAMKKTALGEIWDEKGFLNAIELTGLALGLPLSQARAMLVNYLNARSLGDLNGWNILGLKKLEKKR